MQATETKIVDLGETPPDELIAALQTQVRSVLAEHKRAGRSVVVLVNDKTVILPPEQIPDWPEDDRADANGVQS